MLENFFLSYANNSFSEKPENLRIVFEEIRPHSYFREVNAILTWEQLIGQLIELIIFLANNYSKNKNLPPRPKDGIYSESFYESVIEDQYYNYGDTYIHMPFIPMALHAIYGPTFNKSEDCKFCIYGRFVGNPYKALKKKKCFECAQLAFINQMSDIASGKELKDYFSFEAGRVIVQCLDLLLETSQDYILTRVLMSNGKVQKDELINISKFINPGIDEQDIGKRFNHFLFSLAGYSLSNFLINTDRRKLKRCPYCNKFFVARDTKRKICYTDSCMREYKRLQKEKQRRDNPVKYI